jgi:hypothetical protein
LISPYRSPMWGLATTRWYPHKTQNYVNFIYDSDQFKYPMTYQELINAGIAYREQTEPEQSLACFGQAFIIEPDSAAAFNNYGNTLREMGLPQRARPFLEHACLLDPGMATAQFNLAVTILLAGDLKQGMQHYESRWRFEHLNGMLPNFKQPVWRGEDLTGKTIAVIGEQGHGDILQFSRFVAELRGYNPQRICFQVGPAMTDLFASSSHFNGIDVFASTDTLPEFDTWSMLMSLPIGLGTDYQSLVSPLWYIEAPKGSVRAWQERLGPKTRQRIGIGWSGRKDTWINRHKAVSFDHIVDLIKSNPEHQWINLQVDASEEENRQLAKLGVGQYPGTISSWGDTAGLLHHLDLYIGVDTAVTHLAGAQGRPTWVMLNQYALDWRWLLDRDDSPWYPSAKLFRQPSRGDWAAVISRITQYLGWWKN